MASSVAAPGPASSARASSAYSAYSVSSASSALFASSASSGAVTYVITEVVSSPTAPYSPTAYSTPAATTVVPALSASSSRPITSATVFTVVVETRTATFTSQGAIVTSSYYYLSSVTNSQEFASLLSAQQTSTDASEPTGSSSRDAGLHTRNIIGIGLGVALALVLTVTIGAIMFYLRRRRLTSARRFVHIPTTTIRDSDDKAELHGQSLPGNRVYERNELEGSIEKQLHEIGFVEKMTAVAELEANSRSWRRDSKLDRNWPTSKSRFSMSRPV